VTPERERELRELEARLGHRFADPGLLERALTHASRANEETLPGGGDNEPLEFLGDAVIGLAVTDLLHRRDPHGPEGAKSQARARLVSSPALARRARDLGIPALLLLGRGEEKSGGRAKTALWANAYEALIAAVYLDGGFERARRIVQEEVEHDIATGAAASEDAKSALQELLQGHGRPLPEYTVAAEDGPSHRRVFRVECRLDDGRVTEGTGHSKKVAQQEAARRALDHLRRQSP